MTGPTIKPEDTLVYDYSEWQYDFFTSGEVVHSAGSYYKCTPEVVLNVAGFGRRNDFDCIQIKPNDVSSIEVA